MQNYGGYYSQYPQGQNQMYQAPGGQNNMNQSNVRNMYGAPQNYGGPQMPQVPQQQGYQQQMQQQNFVFHFDLNNTPNMNMNMGPYAPTNPPQYGAAPYGGQQFQQNVPQKKEDKNDELFHSFDPFNPKPRTQKKPQPQNSQPVTPSQPQIQLIEDTVPKKQDLNAFRTAFASLAGPTQPQQQQQQPQQYNYGMQPNQMYSGNMQNSQSTQIGGFNFAGGPTQTVQTPQVDGFNFAGGSTQAAPSPQVDGFNFAGSSTQAAPSPQVDGFNFAGGSTQAAPSTQVDGFNFAGGSTQAAPSPQVDGFNFAGGSTQAAPSPQVDGFNFAGSSTQNAQTSQIDGFNFGGQQTQNGFPNQSAPSNSNQSQVQSEASAAAPKPNSSQNDPFSNFNPISPSPQNPAANYVPHTPTPAPTPDTSLDNLKQFSDTSSFLFTQPQSGSNGGIQSFDIPENGSGGFSSFGQNRSNSSEPIQSFNGPHSNSGGFSPFGQNQSESFKQPQAGSNGGVSSFNAPQTGSGGGFQAFNPPRPASMDAIFSFDASPPPASKISNQPQASSNTVVDSNAIDDLFGFSPTQKQEAPQQQQQSQPEIGSAAADNPFLIKVSDNANPFISPKKPDATQQEEKTNESVFGTSPTQNNAEKSKPASSFGDSFRQAIGETQQKQQPDADQQPKTQPVDFNNIFSQGSNFFEQQEEKIKAQQQSNTEGFNFGSQADFASNFSNFTFNSSTAQNNSSQPSAFGESPFGAPSTTQSNNTQASAFGESPFGAPSTAQNSNAQASAFGESPFGAPSMTQNNNAPQASAFGESPFGATSTTQSNNAQASAFGESPFGTSAAPHAEQPAQPSISSPLFDPFGVSNLQPMANSTFIISGSGDSVGSQPVAVSADPVDASNIPYFAEQKKKMEFENRLKSDTMSAFDPFNPNPQQIQQPQSQQQPQPQSQPMQPKQEEPNISASVNASVNDIRDMFGGLRDEPPSKEEEKPQQASDDQSENNVAANDFSGGFSPTFGSPSSDLDQNKHSDIQLNAGMGEEQNKDSAAENPFAMQGNGFAGSFGNSPDGHNFVFGGFGFGGSFGNENVFHKASQQGDLSKPATFADFFPQHNSQPLTPPAPDDALGGEAENNPQQQHSNPLVEPPKSDPQLAPQFDFFNMAPSPIGSDEKQQQKQDESSKPKENQSAAFDFSQFNSAFSNQPKEEEKPKEQPKPKPQEIDLDNPFINSESLAMFGQAPSEAASTPVEQPPSQPNKDSFNPFAAPEPAKSSANEPNITLSSQSSSSLSFSSQEVIQKQPEPAKQPSSNTANPKKNKKSTGNDILDDIPSDISEIDTSLPEKPPPFIMPTIGDISSNPFANVASNQASNPFTSSSTGNANPFVSSASSNPFAPASSSQKPAADPFAAPKKEENSNPFATSKPEENSNPFTASKPEENSNPFTASKPEENSNPFTASKPEENSNPFATSKPAEKEKTEEPLDPFATETKKQDDDKKGGEKKSDFDDLLGFDFGFSSPNPVSDQPKEQEKGEKADNPFFGFDSSFSTAQKEVKSESPKEEAKPEKKEEPENAGFTFTSATTATDSKDANPFSKGFNPFGGDFSNPFAASTSTSAATNETQSGGFTFTPAFGADSEKANSEPKPESKSESKPESNSEPKSDERKDEKEEAKEDKNNNNNNANIADTLVDDLFDFNTVETTPSSHNNNADFLGVRHVPVSNSTSDFREMKKKEAKLPPSLKSDGDSGSNTTFLQRQSSNQGIISILNPYPATSQNADFSESSDGEDSAVLKIMSQDSPISSMLKKYIKQPENDFYGSFEKEPHPIRIFPKFEDTNAAKVLAEFVSTQFGITASFASTSNKKQEEIDVNSIFNAPAASEPNDDDDFLIAI